MATLLHYFLLASFSWMLCEGIMLFLLLVVVFSTMAKKWWGFLIMGWGMLSRWHVALLHYAPYTALLGLPLPVVIVSVAVRHSQYGIRDSNGNLIAYVYLIVGTHVVYQTLNKSFLLQLLASFNIKNYMGICGANAISHCSMCVLCSALYVIPPMSCMYLLSNMI